MDITKRQQEIIQAAIQVLAYQGIQGLTIKEIAKVVGIKESSIYFHFKSKQEILSSILQVHKVRSTSFFKDINELNVSNLKKLQAYFFEMGKIIEREPDYVKLVLFESHNFLDISQEETRLIFTYPQNQVTEIIKKAQENNEIRKDLDVSCLVSTLRGYLYIILKHKLYIPDFDALQSCEKHWEFFEELISIN